MSLDTILPQLRDPHRPVASTALAGLSKLESSEHERFLDVWRVLSIQRRRDIIDRLAGLAEDNVELDFNRIFLAGLVDSDVQVRSDSIRALWEYEGRDLASMLVTMLRDPEALVRAEAALGLGRYVLRAELSGEQSPELREIEQALRALAADERELPEVRGRAIEALGARSEPWVTRIIENAYDSGERRLRISAIHAMGRSADPSWLPRIVEEMQSEDAEARYEAAVASGSIGDEDAVPHLVPLLRDDDAEVQEAAIEALGQIGGRQARSALETIAAETKDERVLEAVGDALAEADFVDDPLGYRLRLPGEMIEDVDDDAEDGA